MSTEYREQVGRLLRERRLELKLTQKAVADQLHEQGVKITPDQYGHWERGIRAILSDYLPALAQVLRLDEGVFSTFFQQPSEEAA